MALLFPQQTNNVLDSVNGASSLADDFSGGIFEDADSNFLGIAIGKKAKARKAAKRADRQAGRKYKLETERIRALQGQPKENITKDIVNGLTSVASTVFGGVAAQKEQPFSEQAYEAPAPEPPKNNTILIIIAAVIVVGAIFILKK